MNKIHILQLIMAKIFYFPGTTTSYHMAQKISLRIPDFELIKITFETSYGQIDDDIVGIVFPVFYYGLPETVEVFLKNIKVTKKAYFFIAVTSGVFMSNGIKKQLLSKLPYQVAYFQHKTMGESFDIDLWKYASAMDKRQKYKQLDVSADKIAKSVKNSVIQRQIENSSLE